MDTTKTKGESVFDALNFKMEDFEFLNEMLNECMNSTISDTLLKAANFIRTRDLGDLDSPASNHELRLILAGYLLGTAIQKRANIQPHSIQMTIGGPFPFPMSEEMIIGFLEQLKRQQEDQEKNGGGKKEDKD